MFLLGMHCDDDASPSQAIAGKVSNLFAVPPPEKGVKDDAPLPPDVDEGPLPDVDEDVPLLGGGGQ